MLFNIIHKHMFWNIIKWTLIGSLVLCVIVALVQSLQFIKLIINNGINFGTFIYLIILSLPRIISFVLPIALFITTIFYYRRMNNDGEIVALRAAGVSHIWLAWPCILVSILTTILLYFMYLYVNPISKDIFVRIQLNAKSQLALSLLQEGQFIDLDKNITLYVNSIDENRHMQGLFINDRRDEESPQIIIAASGQLFETNDGPLLFVNDGAQQFIKDGKLHHVNFDEYNIILENAQNRFITRWQKPEERSTFELFTAKDDTSILASSLPYIYAELHNRLSFPLLAPLLCLLALYILLNSRYDRNGDDKMPIFISSFLAMGIVSLNLSLISSLKKYPELWPLLYLITGVFIVILLGLLLFHNTKSPAKIPINKP